MQTTAKESTKPLVLRVEPGGTSAVTIKNATMTPMEMVSQAVMNGASMDLLERLMNLQERYEKTQARRDFIEAKTAFKAEVPKIIKDKANDQFKSKYASIGNLVANVNAALSKHGLDARWEIEQGDKAVKVTCILAHLSGHSESAVMSGPPDTSGAKNPIQQIKSTITYLKVATYEAVTGIASEDGNKDDDGNASNVAVISDAQVNELIALADEAEADKGKVCAWLKVESFADITVKQFQKAKNALATAKQNKASA